MHALRLIVAFANGMYGFRSEFIPCFDDVRHLLAYHWGCEIAHRVTLRRYERGGL